MVAGGEGGVSLWDIIGLGLLHYLGPNSRKFSCVFLSGTNFITFVIMLNSVVIRRRVSGSAQIARRNSRDNASSVGLHCELVSSLLCSEFLNALELLCTSFFSTVQIIAVSLILSWLDQVAEVVCSGWNSFLFLCMFSSIHLRCI